jgi:hypothetical protein
VREKALATPRCLDRRHCESDALKLSHVIVQ